jgi:conjugative transfer signal peptidase TraF
MTRLVNRMALGAAAMIALGLIADAAGAKINTSHSIPVGLYWRSDKRIEKNDYVLFCPPPRAVFNDARQRGYIGAGFCPGGYGYMMKRVRAAGNDTISIDDGGVRVNGQLLPDSAPRRTDRARRALPRYCATRTLQASEVLLMGDPNPNSFDARYFGPIPISNIHSVIRPVFIW